MEQPAEKPVEKRVAGTEQGSNASRAARRRARYREVARVLWEERLLGFFPGVGLEDHLPATTAREEGLSIKEKDLPQAVRIRHALERLGPVFIKVGQQLATRSDLLPAALMEELAKLQDDVPAMPWPAMKGRIETELGAPVAELFGSFAEQPLAAASIGQVYRATLPDGTPVAVKVQRPGVTEAMEMDLEIMHDLAGRVEKLTQWGKDNDVATLADDLASILRSELDYTVEGHWLDRFRSAFADDASLVFPQVYWDHTTRRVLTMDFIQGVPATQLENSGQAEGVDRTHLVDIGIGAYFRMIFQLGFYHADPHAGNLFALPGGRLAFVDFGRVATVSERNRDAAFDLLLAVLDDDAVGVSEAVLTMTGMPSRVDLAALEIDIAAMLAQYRRQQATGGGLEKLIQRLLKLMRDHRLHLPNELTVLLTTLGMAEGVATQLDPDFRLIDAAKPFARKLMPEQFGPERIVKASLRAARAYGRFFDQLPVQATRALRRAGEGEFQVAVRPTDYAELVDRLTAGFYLLAYALIVGSLIVGFAFLVGRQGLAPAEQIGYRVVLFTAIASVVWLLVRVLRNGWRRRQAGKRRVD
jgi:ubiquinone biosynthesis protein